MQHNLSGQNGQNRATMWSDFFFEQTLFSITVYPFLICVHSGAWKGVVARNKLTKKTNGILVEKQMFQQNSLQIKMVTFILSCD